MTQRTQRMSAYSERTRRMPNINLPYICVCERRRVYERTLMPYAVL